MARRNAGRLRESWIKESFSLGGYRFLAHDNFSGTWRPETAWGLTRLFEEFQNPTFIQTLLLHPMCKILQQPKTTPTTGSYQNNFNYFKTT